MLSGQTEFVGSLRQLIRGMFRNESQRRPRNAWLLSRISIGVFGASRITLMVAESGSTFE